MATTLFDTRRLFDFNIVGSGEVVHTQGLIAFSCNLKDSIVDTQGFFTFPFQCVEGSNDWIAVASISPTN